MQRVKKPGQPDALIHLLLAILVNLGLTLALVACGPATAEGDATTAELVETTATPAPATNPPQPPQKETEEQVPTELPAPTTEPTPTAEPTPAPTTTPTPTQQPTETPTATATAEAPENAPLRADKNLLTQKATEVHEAAIQEVQPITIPDAVTGQPRTFYVTAVENAIVVTGDEIRHDTGGAIPQFNPEVASTIERMVQMTYDDKLSKSPVAGKEGWFNLIDANGEVVGQVNSNLAPVIIIRAYQGEWRTITEDPSIAPTLSGEPFENNHEGDSSSFSVSQDGRLIVEIAMNYTGSMVQVDLITHFAESPFKGALITTTMSEQHIAAKPMSGEEGMALYRTEQAKTVVRMMELGLGKDFFIDSGK
jgi:hypothetical protein